MTPDVNVLVAASRSDHPHHAVARRWLEEALRAAAAGAGMSLMPMVTARFLRLVTSPKIFVRPRPIESAIAFLDALIGAPGVRVADLGAEWPRLRQMCLERALGGNRLPDAWLAAAVVHLGEHLVSFDRDFKQLLGSRQFTLLTAP
jgi:uncharacterized protein